MNYTDYGYGPTLYRNIPTSNNYVSAADAPIQIAELPTSQLSGGNVTGDMVVASGRILVKNGEREVLVIDKNGLTLFDETGVARTVIGKIV